MRYKLISIAEKEIYNLLFVFPGKSFEVAHVLRIMYLSDNHENFKAITRTFALICLKISKFKFKRHIFYFKKSLLFISFFIKFHYRKKKSRNILLFLLPKYCKTSISYFFLNIFFMTTIFFPDYFKKVIITKNSSCKMDNFI